MFNWVTVGITAAVTALSCFGLHELDIAYLSAKQKAALAAQQNELVAQCNADKQITTEISNGYEKQLAAANAAIERLRQPVYSVPIAQPATGHNGAAHGGGSTGAHGVNSQTLRDYATDYERERIKLIWLQNFIRDLCKEKGSCN